jgi:hypothetical protein
VGIGALNHLNPGVSAMSSVPLHLERRCEQRWAARFARQTPEPSSQKSENEKQGQQLGAPAKPKGKPAGPGSILRSATRDEASPSHRALSEPSRLRAEIRSRKQKDADQQTC